MKPAASASFSTFSALSSSKRAAVRLRRANTNTPFTPAAATPTKGIYYYTTYDQHQISAVDMHRENLDGNALVCFPMNTEPVVFWQNAAKQ